MDAMIFAAGLGTRLRPLTHDRPKALVEVAGVPVLERAARRLVDAGADRLIINTHHFPERIEEFVRARDDFGVEVHFSHEPEAPLDTGGGLRRAVPLFRQHAPFLLHNCDVISDIDLRALYATHAADGTALATLAVLPPSDQRYLIFDQHGLCGYAPRHGGDDVIVRDTVGTVRRHDFAGIHAASVELLDLLPAQDTFSIINLYLKLAAQGRRIEAYDAAGARWIDIGTHDKLAEAERLLSSGGHGNGNGSSLAKTQRR